MRYTPIHTLFVAFGLSILSILNVDAILEDPNDVGFIERIVEANGGKAAMRQVMTWTFSGTLTNADDTSYKAILIRKAPNKIRLNILEKDARIIVCYDGQTPWMQVDKYGATQIYQEMTPDKRDDIVRDSYFILPLFDYRNMDYTIRRVDDINLSGRDVHVFEIDYKQIDARDVYYIDKENLTLSQRVFYKDFSQDERREVVTTIYGNYIPINGVLVPHRSKTKRADEHVATVEWDSVMPNNGIFDSYFEFEPARAVELMPQAQSMKSGDSESVAVISE